MTTRGSRIQSVRCPYCSADATQVIDTRPADDAVRRRRECGACGQRFTTDEQLEAVAAWIAAEVRREGGEALAERIGDLAERGLARVDPVSAIQFASVYRNLADLDELEAVVRRFKEDPLPGEHQLAIEGSVPSEPESNIGLSRAARPTRRRGHVR